MKLSRTSGLVRKQRRTLPGRGQKGFVLIEVLASIAILGVISVGFLGALVAGYHGVLLSHDQTKAESLTRSAFEKMRGSTFPYGTAADNYTTTTTVEGLDVVVHGVFVTDNYSTSTTATSMQLITVTIKHHANGKVVLETQTNKVQI